jgi:exodeoxyribonuclease V gamma subunit
MGDLLAGPRPDLFAREVVAVPTRGVERWLTQRLSHRLGLGGAIDGVCANVDFPFPGTLIGTATGVASGFEPDTDPWPPDRSVWPLLELVDELLDQPFLESLAGHLKAADPAGGNDGHAPRRFATIRHLSDLYDRYAVHRPDMVRAWAEGVAWQVEAHPDRAWQAELWRRLRERIGVPSPAERFETAAARLADEPELLDLPDRLSLFGLTRLPASHLQVLEAIAVHRDVHLFLLHPSGALWDKVQGAEPRPPAPLRREDDPTRTVPDNPLLRSWGRDSREMQLVLGSHGVAGGEHRAVPDETGTLLGLIQADVRADRMPAGPRKPGDAEDPRPPLRDDDDSLRIHSCHGRARQVEVVRDAVLHLLAADETLEPRDVIVMCPDVETFAPLVHAAFGTGLPDQEEDAGLEAGPPQLRVRLADRSIRQTNPLLAVAAQLLELADGRVTASQVLDLASREPVSRRFRFDEEELSQIERWVAGTGIRWGLDGAHRAPWALDGVDANTWRAGVDRLLLGVAMGEDGQRLFGDALPYDDVSSTGVDLAGRFTEMLTRLGETLDELSGCRPIDQWSKALAAGTERLAVSAAADTWQHEQLHRVLGEVVEEAQAMPARPASAELDLAEIRSLLAERLRGRPTRANFRTGDLTICTLVPMRSVPHRVVCLLGLDDGVFPRHTEQDGDDLLLADPRVGDRDARSEDRQLLLDALLAATEKLIVTFEGRDQRTNQERPPAVPVAELLDVVDRTVRHPDPTKRARDAVLVQHPLQSFDARNFADGALVDGGPWSFDPVNLDGARALKSEDRQQPRPFLAERLPPLDRPVIQLDSLIRFVEHPVKAFLRERLGLYVSDGPDRVNDALPVELDALEKWGVGDRILEARLAGADPDRAVLAERGRGLLPPGALADAVLDDVSTTVEALVAAVGALPCAEIEAESVEVNLQVPDGRSLVGTVPGVRDGVILRCVFSRLGPKHRLAAWVPYLALAACSPELNVAAVTIGRGQGSTRSGPRVRMSTIELPGEGAARQAAALTALESLVHLYDRGMREPLPLYCCTSAAWAAAMRGDVEQAVAAARKEWRAEPESPVPGEDRDPEHVLVLGEHVPFDAVRDEEPREYEVAGSWPGGGWAAGERSRFGGFARRLWDPLLDCESLT